jgi:hypothetical protein
VFNGDVEDGGEGFLISCDRCINYKMPLCNSYHSSRDELTGKIKFKRNAIKNVKGVPILVDGHGRRHNNKTMFPFKKSFGIGITPSELVLLS